MQLFSSQSHTSASFFSNPAGFLPERNRHFPFAPFLPFVRSVPSHPPPLRLCSAIPQLRARTRKIWSAVAERSDDTAFRARSCRQSGVPFLAFSCLFVAILSPSAYSAYSAVILSCFW